MKRKLNLSKSELEESPLMHGQRYHVIHISEKTYILISKKRLFLSLISFLAKTLVQPPRSFSSDGGGSVGRRRELPFLFSSLLHRLVSSSLRSLSKPLFCSRRLKSRLHSRWIREAWFLWWQIWCDGDAFELGQADGVGFRGWLASWVSSLEIPVDL